MSNCHVFLILVVAVVWWGRGVTQQSQSQTPSDTELREMELATFYSDCSVYEDDTLFGGPVCGSDNQDYANCVHFACLNYWRPQDQKLTILQKGRCPIQLPQFSFSPIFTPVCGSDNVTYANVEALILRNEQALASGGKEVLVQYEGECCRLPPFDPSGWQGAVCATNGRTYPDTAVIADMRRFGQCLDVLHDGGCTVDEVKERVRSRSEVCDLARNFYEVNPVCGEDDVTYLNPYILLCFRPNVEVQYMTACNSSIHKFCQHAVDIDTGVATSAGEVCGGDGLTYPSHAHLECAKNNDKHLFQRHKGACTNADNPCQNLPLVVDGGTPVCGSDGVSYINSFALWCVQRSDDPFLQFFHDGPCFRRCVECSSCGMWCGIPS